VSHESTTSQTHVWLTPPHIIDALGGAASFDFDPCAAPEPRPWPTALAMNARLDANGLQIRWRGRVWLNPPYDDRVIAQWLGRMAEHDHGTALLGVRTENEAWRKFVWGRASGLLFLFGRLHYCRPDGRPAKGNAGHASVLCSYGQDDLDRLANSNLEGHLVPLRFARSVLVAGVAPGTWSEAMVDWLKQQRGPVALSDAYRAFARHPKSARNPHWQAKVRQQLRRHARRVAPQTYEVAA
jgi:hypothetical protein